MFKIGTALVTGVLAAFLTVLTAVSAGARFSTAAGRSLAVFLVVTALIFLVAFFLEKQFPALFAQVQSEEIPTRKEGKATQTANDKEESEGSENAGEDGEAADAQANGQEQDADFEVMEEPAAAVPRGE